MNGRAGKGTRRFERVEAEQLAEELNREYPQIEHEVVSAEPEGKSDEPSQPATVAMSAS